MEFLDNLFNRRQSDESVPVTLDLRDNGFILNGVRFSFPARASEFIKLLGEPRIAEDQMMECMRNIYCEKYNFNPDTFNPLDYYWDSMGLLARTLEQETIYSLLIYFRKSKYPYPMPKCGFSGTLLIHGRPWQECVLKKGGLHGAVPLGNLHLNVSRYGKETSEKAVGVMELGLNHDVKLEFFK